MTEDPDPMNRDLTPDPFDRSETKTGAAGSADGYSAGSFIKHRYEILAAGRRGGMGAVYHCRDHKLTMEKALKVVHPHLLKSPQALQRFRQEVSISLQLSHEGIVRVYDLDEDEGREFFTMEWVEGKSLRELLSERKTENRPFALEEAGRIIAQLCDALQYAHRHTIHRDIKPENILVKQDGEALRIKLTDFGIAKMLTASQLTSTSLQMGTPYYMAPEQKLDAGNVDKRADIYAAGVVLFELLTLENTIGFDLPSEINPDLPKEIDAVIRKAMATRPENRYGDAGEFALALSVVAKADQARKDERARLAAELAEQKKREEAEEKANREVEDARRVEAERKARAAAGATAERRRQEESSQIFTSSTTGAKFVLIPSRSFYMQTTEVTQGQWRKVMENNPSYFKNCGDDCPVEQVSWNDVQEFIRKLNSQEGTDKYRLPTEAEWETAARAGTTTEYSFGDSESDLKDYGWYDGNSGGRTHPVGQKRPNAWGLYDVHGNVWEWVQDQAGSSRVSRGGSWGSVARLCRSASRSVSTPGSRSNFLGFRLARTQ